MARKKKTALDVPASPAEAAALLAQYRAADRQAKLQQLISATAIDAMKSELGDSLRAIDADQAQRFDALKSWWEAGGKALAGKNRSAEIDGVKLGIRTGMPRLKLPKGLKADDIVKWLGSLRWSGKLRFLRTKTTLDKEAVIKAMRSTDDSDAAIRTFSRKGLVVEQADEFFIDTGLDEATIKKELTNG